MNSKEKGDIAVAKAIAYFVENRYEVLLPLGDKRDYDFVIEKNGKLEKVQVKYAGKYKSGVCKVGLRITGGNQSYTYSKKYQDSAFNILFVYTANRESFVIPWSEVECRNEISIDTEKYKKFHVN